MPSRFIDPTTDFGFKRLFAAASNKDLLLYFLNAVFRGEKVLRDLQLHKNEFVGDDIDSGCVVLDLICTAADGSYMLIEMQNAAHKYFEQRMLYYGSKLIVDQAPKGNRALWNYNLKAVYVIVIMDGFTLAADDGEVIQDIALHTKDTWRIFCPAYRYIFISLKNFQLDAEALTSELDGWLYILKHASTINEIPEFLKKPVFLKWFAIAEYVNLNKEDKDMYNQSLKNKWDKASTLAYAREEGEAQGIAKGEARGIAKGEAQGIAKGEAQGIAKGEARGIAKGEARGIAKGEARGIAKGEARGIAKGEAIGALAAKREIAGKMKAANVPLETIASCSGLSIEEIKKL